MNARQINQMIADAEKRGRNVYGDNLLDGCISITIDSSIRVIRARTVFGSLKVRTPNGNWFRVGDQTTFDAR